MITTLKDIHEAGATFQRLLDEVLKGTEGFAAAYLDDVMIYSKTWQDHLQHVKTVLKKISATG